MKVEAHLGANCGKNGRFEFEKSFYPNRKSRIWSILLINSNKLYLFRNINKMKKVILYYIFNIYESGSTFRCQLW